MGQRVHPLVSSWQATQQFSVPPTRMGLLNWVPLGVTFLMNYSCAGSGFVLQASEPDFPTLR